MEQQRVESLDGFSLLWGEMADDSYEVNRQLFHFVAFRQKVPSNSTLVAICSDEYGACGTRSIGEPGSDVSTVEMLYTLKLFALLNVDSSGQQIPKLLPMDPEASLVWWDFVAALGGCTVEEKKVS